jgi:hypothetical protein
MQNNTVTFSVIDSIYNKIKQNPANIIYLKTGSMFDQVICSSLNHNVFVYGSTDEIDFNSINYDFCIASEPISYSQYQSRIQALNMPSLLLVHNHPISNIKKEDKFLLARYLTDVQKVFFDINIAENWAIGYNNIIGYGFPDIVSQEIKKTESVVVLNPNNIRQTAILYQSIKNQYPSASMVSYKDFVSLSDLLAEISKYQVAISIDYIYDSIVCGLLGCHTITTQKNKYLDLEIVSNFSNINSIIGQALDKPPKSQHNIYDTHTSMVIELDKLINTRRNKL